jgi:hypothetical protein
LKSLVGLARGVRERTPVVSRVLIDLGVLRAFGSGDADRPGVEQRTG